PVALLRHRSLLRRGPPRRQLYSLSLHDALPISTSSKRLPALTRAARVASGTMRTTAESTFGGGSKASGGTTNRGCTSATACSNRSEEHMSELQSRENLVCRLLLEKKNQLGHGGR